MKLRWLCFYIFLLYTENSFSVNTPKRPFKEEKNIYRNTHDRNYNSSSKARIGYIDVFSLRDLPKKLGLKSVIENEKTTYKKTAKSEEIEVLYNLLIVRVMPLKNGSSEFDDFISGRRDKNGKPLVPKSFYTDEVEKIKKIMDRKIIISISRKEIMHNKRWKCRVEEGSVRLSKYFQRLADFIPKLGFSGALFEIPTVGPQSIQVDWTKTQLIAAKNKKKKLGIKRTITFQDPRLAEEDLFEFLQSICLFAKVLKYKSQGRVFTLQATDSTLLSHKYLQRLSTEEHKPRLVVNLETNKILSSNLATSNELKKTFELFKRTPDYILLMYNKIETIRKHIIKRYYTKINEHGQEIQLSVPKALSKTLYGVPKQRESVAEEIDLLIRTNYQPVVLLLTSL